MKYFCLNPNCFDVNSKGKVLSFPTAFEYTQYFNNNKINNCVARTKILGLRKIVVSTVLLPVALENKPPKLFETMVFGLLLKEEPTYHYPYFDLAHKHHYSLVEALQNNDSKCGCSRKLGRTLC